MTVNTVVGTVNANAAVANPRSENVCRRETISFIFSLKSASLL
jgi:hypothetical protein